MTRDVTVVFCCPHCLTAYQAAQSRTVQECTGEFYCERCGTPIHEWVGLYDFTRWKPVSEGRSSSRKQRRQHAKPSDGVGATMMLP